MKKLCNINNIMILTIILSIIPNLYAQNNSIKTNTQLKLIDSSVNISKTIDISINFTKNILYGNSGCNNYSAEYKIKDNNLIYINYPFTTRMYCQNKMQDETIFLDFIKNVNHYKINNDTLDLYQDDNFLFRFN